MTTTPANDSEAVRVRIGLVEVAQLPAPEAVANVARLCRMVEAAGAAHLPVAEVRAAMEDSPRRA